jgi:thiol-disulfide isomerase/thioredoxin
MAATRWPVRRLTGDRIRLMRRLLHPPSWIRGNPGLWKLGRLGAVRPGRLLPIALATLVVTACSSKAPDFFVRVSGPMPAISAPTLDGGRVEPADYARKVVVVNFWNQDCPPCRQEMPLLQSEARRLKGKGVTVIGVLYVGGNWPNDPQEAGTFLERMGIGYPNVTDQSSVLAREFGIAGIPSTVVVDRSGRMRFRVLGRLKPGQIDTLISMLEER